MNLTLTSLKLTIKILTAAHFPTYEKTIAIGTGDLYSSTGTENSIELTPRRMSDHGLEASPSVSVTSEEIAGEIQAVAVPLSQQLAHLCDLMRELRKEQVNRRHEETASFRAASSSKSSSGRSDNMAWKMFLK